MSFSITIKTTVQEDSEEVTPTNTYRRTFEGLTLGYDQTYSLTSTDRIIWAAQGTGWNTAHSVA